MFVVNYYPKTAGTEWKPDTNRISPHTDETLVTLLFTSPGEHLPKLVAQYAEQGTTECFCHSPEHLTSGQARMDWVEICVAHGWRTWQMRQHGASKRANLPWCWLSMMCSCSGSAGLEVAAGKDGKAVDSKEGHYAVGCLS